MRLNRKNETFIPKKTELAKKWWLINAEGMILGRLATQITTILRGKDHPNYTPFFDCGDHIVVINARKVKVTGKKETQKIYYRHSGYRGGLKEVPLERMMATNPERVILNAVRRMLPKNRLNRKILTKIRIYPEAEHQHGAQKPEPLKIKGG